MSEPEVMTEVSLDNDELIVIEPLQYGAYDAANFAPGCSACCNCNCNSNSGANGGPLD